MPLTVLQHALAAHILAQLRATATPPEHFRALTRALTQILVVEAARDLPTRPITVLTPLEETAACQLDTQVVLVPVLRAGLGMLEAALELLPQAVVGYVGLERDEQTAIASSYYCKLPATEGRTALLLDPMLATGGSAAWAANQLYAAGAARVKLLCVVAAPQGVARLAESFPKLEIIAASLDRDLNDRKFILPGLGDFGDRLYGTF
ncbi:MAG TPA: uracil phosphoribosyltransferase [Chthonomonadaceae bacterium]|nr:uracil phosphoribosyltransferase [Chthonomonadaceae bacterium]